MNRRIRWEQAVVSLSAEIDALDDLDRAPVAHGRPGDAVLAKVAAAQADREARSRGAVLRPAFEAGAAR